MVFLVSHIFKNKIRFGAAVINALPNGPYMKIKFAPNFILLFIPFQSKRYENPTQIYFLIEKVESSWSTPPRLRPCSHSRFGTPTGWGVTKRICIGVGGHKNNQDFLKTEKPETFFANSLFLNLSMGLHGVRMSKK